VVAAAAWGAALACVPHPSADPVCEGSEVTGTRQLTFVTDKGDQTRAFPTAATNVNALLPLPGSSRGYVACNGSESNGNLSVGMVPDGTYLFQVEQLYAFTTQRSVDFTQFVLGRTGLKFPTQVTPITFANPQMDAWSTMDDRLEIYSSNASFQFSEPDKSLGAIGPPSDGDTSLALTVDWKQLGAFPTLLDGTQDTLLINQLETRPLTVGNGTALALVKQATASPTLSDGVSRTISTPFVQLPTMSFTATWSRAAGHASADGMAGDSATSSQSFLVQALPEGKLHGLYDLNMSLFGASFNVPSGDDFTLGADFGQPPKNMDPVVVTQELFPVTRFGEQVFGNVQQEESIGNATISALCAVVRAPKIDGKDLQGIDSSPMVGETPTVSWTLPTPSPDAVRIFVQRPDMKGSHEVVANIVVPTSINSGGLTSVDIPSGVLNSGEQYYLFIDAIVAVGWQPEMQPFVLPMPHCIARFVSQPFSVSF
jgi:hypothetical protein